jgi:natural product biosynthesis luciferase-like monooxygenase protein
VAGRTRIELESLIGFFVNTLVLRTRLDQTVSFRSLLATVRETVLDAFARQDVPFERLVEELRPERDLSHTPLFQTMLIVQNAPTGSLSVEGLRLEAVRAETGGAKFDLTVGVAEAGAELAVSMEYSTELFAAATASRMLKHFGRLIEQVVACPDGAVWQMPLLSESERQQLLVEWNDTESSAAATAGCVHAQFERLAALVPDAIAVICGTEQVSYRALNAQANRIARRLRRLGVGPQSLVGVCVERSVEMVAALLGVLKAGGAYVPLDPVYPQERLAFMVADSGAQVLITNWRFSQQFKEYAGEILCVDVDWEGAVRESASDLRVPLTRDDLAYVIYTSGSTGKPKGVMVRHGAVTNFLEGMDARVGCGLGDTLLAVTSVSFDISVLELFWTLARGARVLLLSEQAIKGGFAKDEKRADKGLAFSLFYFANDESESAGQKYRLLLEGARFADRHGFEALWTPERHFHPFGGLYPNPSVASAALAMTTERLRLRAGSVVMPLHHPIRVAEEWALVDNLSNGRVDIAFASGWHANDFALAPTPDAYADRKRAMLEGIAAVRELWRGEAIKTLNGAGHEVELKVYPKPIQPELPFWLTAAGDPQTFIKAGELGANVLTHLLGQTVEEIGEKIRLYREARAAHGHDPATGRVTLMLHTFIGADRETVRETVRRPFMQYLRSSVGLLTNLAKGLNLKVGREGLSEQDTDALLEFAFNRYFETSALFGTPTSCAPMIETLKTLGVDEVACLIDFGVEEEAVLASLDLLNELKELSNRPAERVEETLDVQARVYGATHMQCTPSMLKLLGAGGEPAAALGSLSVLMLGGEALPPHLAAETKANFPCRLLNMYGPTETTIWSATHEVRAAEDPVPIGRPITNTRLLVLDETLRPLPVGVPGDLYIGGAGLARGYLKRPELTAERFVPDPFGPAGATIYRTGDRARYSPDGTVAFIGRDDHQVKLRGYRIELSEIETILAEHASVRQAVAVVRADEFGDARLVAYVVPAPGAEPGASELRRHLQAWLPDYMIPAAIVTLDALPLTPNGKLDRKALPAPDGATVERAPAFVAPQTQTEKELADIWGEILRLEGVGLHDNFFDLGGHSLQVVRVVSRIEARFGVKLPLREFFMSPTIGALAPRIEDEVVAQSDPAKMDELLDLLEAMDDEEVLRMLSPDEAADLIAEQV